MKDVEKYLMAIGAGARVINTPCEQDFLQKVSDYQNNFYEGLDCKECLFSVESLTKKEIVELLKKGFNLESEDQE